MYIAVNFLMIILVSCQTYLYAADDQHMVLPGQPLDQSILDDQDRELNGRELLLNQREERLNQRASDIHAARYQLSQHEDEVVRQSLENNIMNRQLEEELRGVRAHGFCLTGCSCVRHCLMFGGGVLSGVILIYAITDGC